MGRAAGGVAGAAVSGRRRPVTWEGRAGSGTGGVHGDKARIWPGARYRSTGTVVLLASGILTVLPPVGNCPGTAVPFFDR